MFYDPVGHAPAGNIIQISLIEGMLIEATKSLH
jgi:hypothetical protein